MAGAVQQFPFGNVSEPLEYGTATEGDALVKQWIASHGENFGHFVDGEWYKPDNRDNHADKRPSNGETLAHTLEATAEDVEIVMSAATRAFTEWNELLPFVRAKHLYSVARNLQKHQSLLAIVEALDTGRPTKETRGQVVPAIIRQFYHFAGWPQLLPTEMRGWSSIGVTAVFPGSSSPLLQLAQRVAPALAAGNPVVVMPSSHSPLSALLFADICAQAGLPKGVVNVLTGCTPGLLASHPKVDVVSLSGSADEGRAMRQLVAGSGKKLSMELSGHCPILVFEEADLDSAVESVVDAAFSNCGQNTYSASRLLVQESVFATVINKLKVRMSKLTVGDNMDKNNDQGSLCDPGAVLRLEQAVQEARAHGAEVFQPGNGSARDSFPPTLITGAQPSSQIYVDEPCGPVLVAIPFRTEKEGVTLANHGTTGTAAGVWTENISVALEVTSLLNSATVWVNCYGLLDAASSSGGVKASGFGRSGGKTCLYNYMKPAWQVVIRTTNSEVDLDKFGTSSKSNVLPGLSAQNGGDDPSVDKTYKLFYGGDQKRPDSGASVPVRGREGGVVGYTPDGGKKDVRNAVEAAVKAAPGWGKKDGHGRSQILYYMAENLHSQRSDFISLLDASGVYGCEVESRHCVERVVDLAVERLFYWAAYCDKYGRTVQESSFYGHNYEMHNPLGVIGIACPDDFPFLAFISLIAPAIARGNAVVVVPSRKFPLAALAFHQILETSDVPAGVVNILSGDCDILARTLAQHQDVSAVWYFAEEEAGSTFVEASAGGGTMKRSWVCHGRGRDWADPRQYQAEEFLVEATATKSVWLPMGDIFAN